MTAFKPVSRKCIYCKEFIYITQPTKRVTCSRCGKAMGVVDDVKLSKII